MSGVRRLERLYEALSGKEEAKLVLAAYKSHEPHDRAIAAGLSGRQICAYNRPVGIMNFCNDELAQIVLMVNIRRADDGRRVPLKAAS
jgi:hypothetical protein